MKKVTALVMGLTAVFALTACNNKGTEVKAEDFQKKAAAVEEHQYSEATIKWSYYSEISSPDFTALMAGKTDAENKVTKEDDKGETKVTFSNGEWTTSDKNENALMFVTLLQGNLKDINLSEYTSGLSAQADHLGVKSEVKYYTNPLGIEINANGTYADAETGTGSLKMSAYVAFDKYGYVTKVEETVKSSGTAKYGEVSYSSSMDIKLSATVSYK